MLDEKGQCELRKRSVLVYLRQSERAYEGEQHLPSACNDPRDVDEPLSLFLQSQIRQALSARLAHNPRCQTAGSLPATNSRRVSPG